MAADTPDVAALRADMRAKAEAFGKSCWYAGPLAWFEARKYDNEKLGIYDGPDLVCVLTDYEYRVKLTHAHIAASCPANILAVLDADAAEIARLKAERDKFKRQRRLLAAHVIEVREHSDRLEARATAAEARVADLEEALRPFAKSGQLFPPRGPDDYDACVYAPAAGDEYSLCGDDLRRAARLLQLAGDAASGQAGEREDER